MHHTSQRKPDTKGCSSIDTIVMKRPTGEEMQVSGLWGPGAGEGLTIMAHVNFRVTECPVSPLWLHALSVSVRTQNHTVNKPSSETSSDWPQHILHSCITCPGDAAHLLPPINSKLRTASGWKCLGPGPGGHRSESVSPKVPTVSVWTPPVTQEFTATFRQL